MPIHSCRKLQRCYWSTQSSEFTCLVRASDTKAGEHEGRHAGIHSQINPAIERPQAEASALKIEHNVLGHYFK